MSIVEFIEARLADDEREARGAYGAGMDVLAERLRREIEAKRAILRFHAAWPVLTQTEPKIEFDGDDITSLTARMSQRIAWLTTQEYIARFGTEPPANSILRALAGIWRDHPDFDPRWAE